MKKMAVLLIAVGMLVGIAGCPSFTMKEAYEPQTRSITVNDAYDASYRKALRALASMGADITSQDMNGGTISAKLHNAVLINVVLSKKGADSTLIETTGSLMPNKMVVGEFTEIDDFIKTYQGLP
ncbi:MAG: hypothetical protein ACYC9M_12870 [Desulfobulbaceae bacterium]